MRAGPTSSHRERPQRIRPGGVWPGPGDPARVTCRLPRARLARQGGYTYVGVLLIVAFLGLMLASAGEIWRTSALREKEAELLFVGNQFRQAIASYQRASSGAQELPRTLDDLLEDRRLITVRRHLRQIYPDPMTGKPDWVLVKAGDRIMGVHSRSDGRPFKVAGFDEADADFENASSYREWRFVQAATAGASQPPQAAAAAAGPQTGTQGLSGPAEPAVPTAAVSAAPAEPAAQRPNANPRCETQRLDDQRRCVEAKPDASVAEIGQCMASAAQRAAACERGRMPLDLRLPK